MILYYSATGNTEFAAKEIARLTGDQSIDLLQKIRSNDYSEISSEKPFVICAPIYACEMPIFMSRFLKKVKLIGNKNVYFVFTSGGYSGCACVLAKSLTRKKHLVYKGTADIQMPRNYVASNAYSMQDPQTCKELISVAKEKISQTAKLISEGQILKSRKVHLFETLIIVPFTPFWVKFIVKGKKFFAEDTCISCGKCSRICPLNNISMVEKKPLWGNNCTHCMACISQCPKDSIEFGNITQGKVRYLFKKYNEE